jgi:phosphoribosylformylglycinamidine synthase
MGLVIGQKDIDTLQKIADESASMSSRWRHRRPSFYFRIKTTGAKPMDFALEDFWKFSKVVWPILSIEIIPI